MIDCVCGTTVLNTDELNNHIIKEIVVNGDARDNHGLDAFGPTVYYQ